VTRLLYFVTLKPRPAWVVFLPANYQEMAGRILEQFGPPFTFWDLPLQDAATPAVAAELRKGLPPRGKGVRSEHGYHPKDSRFYLHDGPSRRLRGPCAGTD